MKEKSVFASNLRVKREEMGLSQQGIANRLRTNARNYRNYEWGKRAPSLELVTKLSEILQCSCDELLKTA